MSFVYALVARGETPLAEYSSVQGNYKAVAVRMLASIDPKKPVHLLEQDKYVFQSLTETDRMTFLCLTDKTVAQQLRQAFLEELQRKWRTKYGSQGATFQSYSKDKEFQPEIQALFTTYNSERAQKLANIKSNISVAQDKMTENLTLALARGEQLEIMDQKADKILQHSQAFNREAANVNRKMCWQRYRWYVVGIVISIILLYIIIAQFCGYGFEICFPKSPSPTPNNFIQMNIDEPHTMMKPSK